MRTLFSSFNFLSSGADAALRRQAEIFRRDLLRPSISTLPDLTGLYESAVPAAATTVIKPQVMRPVVQHLVKPVVTQAVKQVAPAILASPAKNALPQVVKQVAFSLPVNSTVAQTVIQPVAEVANQIVKPANSTLPVVREVVKQIASPVLAPPTELPLPPVEAIPTSESIYSTIANGWKIVEPYEAVEYLKKPKIQIALHILGYLGIMYVAEKIKSRTYHYTVQADAQETKRYKISYEDNKGKITELLIEVPPNQPARVIQEEEI